MPAAIKDLFDFKLGWPATFGGIRALRDFKVDAYCVFAERVERAGAILVGKGNSPVMGFCGATDNPLSARAATRSTRQRTPAAPPGDVRQRWPMGC